MEYAKYKKVLWSFARTFFWAFLGTAVPLLAKMNYTNSWDDWYKVVIFPSFIAGGAALGTAIRTYIGKGDYTKKLYRLPI